jgi:hypothetical protein
MIEQGLSDPIHETDDTIECPICFLVSFERERKRRKKIIIHLVLSFQYQFYPVLYASNLHRVLCTD